MISTNELDHLEATAAADGIERLVVGAVIVTRGTVLLLRRPLTDYLGGIYELPSGKVEPGENLPAALIREVDEETGLKVTSLGSYIGSFDYDSASGRRTRQLNFTVTVVATDPVRLTEHDDYRWTPLTGALPVTAAVARILDILTPPSTDPVA